MFLEALNCGVVLGVSTKQLVLPCVPAGAPGDGEERQVRCDHGQVTRGHGQVTRGHAQVTCGHAQVPRAGAGILPCRVTWDTLFAFAAEWVHIYRREHQPQMFSHSVICASHPAPHPTTAWG